MRRYITINILIMLTVLALAIPAFSQETKTAAPAPEAPKSEAVTASTELSIYGEVQAVKKESSSLSVQYYDYDTDEEKTIELSLAKDTKLENAASIDNIKQNDWVDVTYSVIDGKNVAKSVIVEKEETTPEAGTGVAPAPDTVGENEEF